MKKILLMLFAAGGLAFGSALAQTPYKLEGKVTYNASANIETWSGSTTAISVGDLRWNQESGAISGKVCMETGSFNSGNGIRDNNGRDLLQAVKFPQTCLELSKLDWNEANKGAVLEGTLDFRGQKKLIKISGQMSATATGFNFVGSYKTSFSEWGMTPPRLLFLISNDPIEVKLEAKVTLR